MAKDVVEYSIRVNGVAPGVISTPFHEVTPPEMMEKMESQIPLGRAGTARFYFWHQTKRTI